jgi:hypothetical protein
MTPTHADMAIETLAREVLEAEDDLVESLTEAESYRALLREALQLLHAEQSRANRMERKLRQFMGFDPMHPEQDDSTLKE